MYPNAQMRFNVDMLQWEASTSDGTFYFNTETECKEFLGWT